MRDHSKLLISAGMRRVRPMRAEPAPVPELHASYLNTAKAFWGVYRMQPGSARRQALLNLFRTYPHGQLPVNNHWQANTIDPDLAVLLKRGILKRIRTGGPGFRSVLNRASSKRQTCLVLADSKSAK